MSIHLKTGVDYLMSLPLDQLNEIAETVNEYMEEVEKHGKK